MAGLGAARLRHGGAGLGKVHGLARQGGAGHDMTRRKECKDQLKGGDAGGNCSAVLGTVMQTNKQSGEPKPDA